MCIKFKLKINLLVVNLSSKILQYMNGFNIVMVIAIILFARLGVRLVTGYIKMKKENENDDDNES